MKASAHAATARGAARVRALIVDDEPLARSRLRAMLAREPGLEVIGDADGGPAAVQAIAARRPDLVFLDVQMPGLDGFGVLRCTAAAHRPVVVFVTAHDDHAIRAFEVNAADYLLKPVVAARLGEAVRRAVARVRAGSAANPTSAASNTGDSNAGGVDGVLAAMPPTPQRAARIPVRRGHETILVAAAELSRVEADGDHANLHVGRTVITVREAMSALNAQLAPFGFVRVHRSTLVNAAWVTSVAPAGGGPGLVLRDGSCVRTGRAYREAVDRLRSR